MLDLFNREHTNPERMNAPKPLKWILLDSLIIAGIAMFAVMPFNIPTEFEIYVMVKAFFGSFIFQLAVERGLKRRD